MIIEVRPSKKFKDAWLAFEAPGVEPAFAAPRCKAQGNRLPVNASEAARAKFTYMATTLQPSSAASSLTAAANILKPSVTKKIISGGQTGAVFRFSGLHDYVWR